MMGKKDIRFQGYSADAYLENNKVMVEIPFETLESAKKFFDKLKREF